MNRRVWIRSGLAVLAAAAVVGGVFLWRWLLNEPQDMRALYAQTAAVFFPALSAVAAVGSLTAAWAAWASAKASADTARRAQQALAYHFPPGGGWTSYTEHDDANYRTLIAGGDDLTEQVRGVVLLEVQRMAESVKSFRFTYTVDTGETHSLQVPVGPNIRTPMPGAKSRPRRLDAPNHNMSETNIVSWSAACFVPDGQAHWATDTSPGSPGGHRTGQFDWKLARTD